MYKVILVPLDGSGRAEAILTHVIGLAQNFGSKLVLMRVVDPAISYSGLEGLPVEVTRDLINQEAEEAKTYLETKCGEIKAKHVEAKAVVRYGAVPQTILDVAEAENADLIAIASHGRSGLSRIFYGSVAAAVLQRADRPLLLIRSTEG
jgi:nucleotide-binding universal stress UspA family protein